MLKVSINCNEANSKICTEFSRNTSEEQLNPFQASDPFFTPLKRQKIRFTDVFKVVENEHWPEKGQTSENSPS